MPSRLIIAFAGLCASVILDASCGCAAEPKKTDPTPAKKPVVPYETARDQPLEAKQEIVNKADNHIQYRVEFNGIKKDRVPGYLYLPNRKPGDKPPPAVLMQYGSGGNKTSNYIVAVGKQFVARGYAVLTIDSIDTGERRGKNGKSPVLGLLSAEQIMHYCGDYSRAVDFLASHAEIDKDRLGFVGISWGAITGITFVAYDERVKVMGSMVAGGNFLGLYSKKLAEKVARDGSKSSDPVYHVARIAPRPLLFINVTKDQMILKSWAESLHEAAGPSSKVVWLDCDHYFNGVDRAGVCESVIEFMDKELAGKRPK